MRLAGAARALASLPGLWREQVAEWRWRQELLARHEGLRLGRGVEVRSPDRLQLGRGVTLDSGAFLHCGGMEWSHGQGSIRIGDQTYVGPHAVLFGAGGITIGTGVLISPGVVLASHQHSFDNGEAAVRDQPSRFAPITIEDDVWIGSNATVLPGVTIGKGSVVGAGAVVTDDVAAGSVCVGVPARVVRRR